jgi:hypothetical protein
VYALVQQFAAEGTYQGLPVPALVEDDNGVRLLLAGPLIGMQVWSDAQVGGAAGVLRVLGAQLAWVDAETFQAYCKENKFVAAYELDELRWSVVDPGLTVFEMQAFADNDPAHFASQNPFVHLHCHSDFSALDGYSLMDEIVALAVADKQRAVAVTDHGTCAGHPALRKASEGLVRPIYGMEANFVDDHDRTDRDYYHLVVWARPTKRWSTSGRCPPRGGTVSTTGIDWDSPCSGGAPAWLSPPYAYADHCSGCTRRATSSWPSRTRPGSARSSRTGSTRDPHQPDGTSDPGQRLGRGDREPVPRRFVVDSHYATAERRAITGPDGRRTGKDVGDDRTARRQPDYTDDLRRGPQVTSHRRLGHEGDRQHRQPADSCREIVPAPEMPIFRWPPRASGRAKYDVERPDAIIEAWPTRTRSGQNERPYLAQLSMSRRC